ncbi:hypothetical protein NQ315_000693 [Exocentrus adspersus]|uniref:Methyltransferase domain-containing protein n=1 Tax=Exocentrus adspersus TaxID=1586481 RepID=A0AAV8WEP6_9CUCU|nr:hypothetical protein NQ315_000693 [Exocentrus adspersus]
MNLSVKSRVKISYSLYQNYIDIIESYVSDYYVENHWNKLPESWQSSLRSASMEQIAELLDLKRPVTKGVFPLSLLCLRNIISSIVISRDSIVVDSHDAHPDQSFLKYFWKNVKLKKRHEIEKMAQICYDAASKTNCFHIVDIGSGLGHLSRMLAYGYGFKVCTFEANPILSSLAREMDIQFENQLESKSIPHKGRFETKHINKIIDSDMHWTSFLNIVTKAFDENRDYFKFGIVGLHPCGNLGSKLLELYNNCPNAVFINIASCCYMKLTLVEEITAGFPLSNYCKENGIRLGYLGCEIACHAIENYVEKLKRQEDYCKLKIHAYRARLEEILVSVDASQAVVVDNLVFLSGVLGMDTNMKLVEGGTAAEARQALKNIGHILEAAGSSYKNVIKNTVMLNDIKDFAAVNEVYKEFFKKDFPARSCYQVGKLPLEANVEIEVIAIVGNARTVESKL